MSRGLRQAVRSSSCGSLVFLLAGLAAGMVLLISPASAALPRSTGDRSDDLPRRTQQVHVLYVLAADGDDLALDTNGTIASSVAVAEHWMSDQTGGKPFRLDTAGGQLDITFVRLGRTEAALAAHGLFIRDEIERELDARGFTDPFKMYAVYYDGLAAEACGGGSWPPTLFGHVVALYLDGQFADPGFADCATLPFAGPGDPPGYREFSFLHELMHAMGAVPTCAPHHTLAGHSSDSPTDLMYAGSQSWVPSVLDIGRDDYFGHGRTDCLDVARSGYLVGNPATALPGETLPVDEILTHHEPPHVVARPTSVAFAGVPAVVRPWRRFKLTVRVRSRYGTPVGKCFFYRLRSGREARVARTETRAGKCTAFVRVNHTGWVRHSVHFAGVSPWKRSAARSGRTLVRRPRR